MAHPAYIREKARQMRVEKNFTIDQIAERLALPRGTIYYWVSDLPIERDPARQSAGQRRRSARNVERCRRRRQEAYEQGAAEFEALARDQTFRDFVCMYIGEGYKRNRNTVAVSNSDPVVISLCFRWIQALSANRVTLSVQHYEDQDPEWLRSFWSFRLGLEPKAISFLPKKNSGRLHGRVWRCRYGVAQVRAHDTQLRARLQGWIDATKIGWTTG
jgi:hypothetical protein